LPGRAVAVDGQLDRPVEPVGDGIRAAGEPVERVLPHVAHGAGPRRQAVEVRARLPHVVTLNPDRGDRAAGGALERPAQRHVAGHCRQGPQRVGEPHVLAGRTARLDERDDQRGGAHPQEHREVRPVGVAAHHVLPVKADAVRLGALVDQRDSARRRRGDEVLDEERARREHEPRARVVERVEAAPAHQHDPRHQVGDERRTHLGRRTPVQVVLVARPRRVARVVDVALADHEAGDPRVVARRVPRELRHQAIARQRVADRVPRVGRLRRRVLGMVTDVDVEAPAVLEKDAGFVAGQVRAGGRVRLDPADHVLDRQELAVGVERGHRVFGFRPEERHRGVGHRLSRCDPARYPARPAPRRSA
jgi:hypothetical protein